LNRLESLLRRERPAKIPIGKTSLESTKKDEITNNSQGKRSTNPNTRRRNPKQKPKSKKTAAVPTPRLRAETSAERK
jgi:hypothetical protein